MKRLLGLMVLIAALAAACSQAAETEASRDDSGVIDEASDIGVLTLRVGDCVQLPSEEEFGEGISEMEAVPCTELHDGEVLDLVLTDGDDDAPYPGAIALELQAERECVERFDTITGLDYVTDPDWGLTFLWPSDVSWDRLDDREIVCIAVPLDLVPIDFALPRL